jgi:hypothetical protein
MGTRRGIGPVEPPDPGNISRKLEDFRVVNVVQHGFARGSCNTGPVPISFAPYIGFSAGIP